MKHILLVLSLAFSFQALSCSETGDFMPDNSLKIPVGSKMANDMTEAKFNQIIDRIADVYRPIIKAKGKKLVVKKKWSNDTVNASAMQVFSMWIVNMYGGLARHADVTDDGFALVMCHELGHHLAGAPKVNASGRNWASNEGQSDYFATLKCFRRVYQNDDNVKIMSTREVPAVVAKKCAEKFTLANDIALCKRSSIAAKGLAKLLNRGKDVDFSTPARNVVTRTNDKHPKGQCRLDTYFHGALCDADIRDDVSNTDHHKGVCSRTRGYKDGTRRLCWYRPQAN